MCVCYTNIYSEVVDLFWGQPANSVGDDGFECFVNQ